MGHKSLIKVTAVVLAAPLLVAGCSRHFGAKTASLVRETTATIVNTTANIFGAPQEYTPVAVRFANAPDMPTFANQDHYTPAGLVADSPYGGFVTNSGNDPESRETYHVALWGGDFDGHNVTRSSTDMTPGAYTVAFFDHKNDAMYQGWIEVRASGDDILDVLYQWKQSIPVQKQRLAYNYQLEGRTAGGNSESLYGFTRQLQAFDRLEAAIDATINDAARARNQSWMHTRDMLRSANVLILPGGEDVFHSSTKPAFSENDLTRIRSGAAATKIVLAADYDNAVWKLGRIDQLFGELNRCKTVMAEMASRLERRKGLFLLTDHLHNHDKRFIQNERALQATFGAIDELDRQLGDLRNRRMALAFVTELIAPDGAFPTLKGEEQHLGRERIVLDAELNRLNQLIANTDDTSTKRIVLERNRQRIVAAMENLDEQFTKLAEAGTALKTMADSASVIHRQGDTSLITATYVVEDLPFNVRRAIEHESMLTVKLQQGKNLFVPTTQAVAFGQIQNSPKNAFSTWFGESMRPFGVEFPAEFESTPEYTVDPAYVSNVAYKPANTRAFESNQASKKGYWNTQTPPVRIHPVKSTVSSHNHNSARWADNSKSKPTSNKMNSTRRVAVADPGYQRTPTRTFTTDYRWRPPSTSVWATRNTNPKRATANNSRSNAREIVSVNHRPMGRSRHMHNRAEFGGTIENDTVTEVTKKDTCGGPLWLNILYPPCWFAESKNQDSVVDNHNDGEFENMNHRPMVRVADDRGREEFGAKASSKTGCDGPLWLKILVPPCWFVDSNTEETIVDNNNDRDFENMNHQHKPQVRLAVYPEGNVESDDEVDQKNGCECPLWLKILVPPCWFVE